MGVDLLDLWRTNGKLTYRRLQILIDHLPPESALKTAMRDNLTLEEELELAKRDKPDERKHGAWSRQDMLLANVIDEIRRLFWLLHAVNSKKSDQMRPPEPMPRPGVHGRWGPPEVQAKKIGLLRSLERNRGRPPKEEETD